MLDVNVFFLTYFGILGAVYAGIRFTQTYVFSWGVKVVKRDFVSKNKREYLFIYMLCIVREREMDFVPETYTFKKRNYLKLHSDFSLF